MAGEYSRQQKNMADNNPFASIDHRLSSIENKLEALATREQQKIEKKFYAIAEASQKLGVSQITLYRGVESGKIPAKRIGSRVMLPASFVDELK